MPDLRPLQDVPLDQLGGKGANLRALARLRGVHLPQTLVLPPPVFARLVARLSATERASLGRSWASGSDRGALFARLMLEPWPARLLTQVAAAVRQFPAVIVRSSGRDEDTATRSLAGHYHSEVCWPTREDLVLALKRCWLFGIDVYLRYLRPKGVAEEALVDCAARSLSLLLQPVVFGSVSGVFFSRSPLHSGEAMVAANYGTCHSVVDGRLATDVFTWPIARPHRVRAEVKFKAEMTLISPRAGFLPGEPTQTPLGASRWHVEYGPCIATAAVPLELRSEPCLSAAQLAELQNVGTDIEARLGYAVDVEFSFVDGALQVLQARPITTRALTDRAPETTGCSIASPGWARGPVRVVRSLEDVRRVRQGDVVAVVATDPDFMELFYRAAAILAEEGSPLSHTAIVARELGVPCLVGVEGATRGAFLEGEQVTVDALAGRVLRRRARRPPTQALPNERRLVLEVSQLAERRGRSPTLAASALLEHFERTTEAADLTPASLAAHRRALEKRFGLKRLRIHWDLLDDRLAAHERLFDAPAVRKRLVP